MTAVRPPAVAGTFYSADPETLARDVDALLAEATSNGTGVPEALIAPHAGYIYSGPVAATAFATLRKGSDEIRRVVIAGPPHYVPVRGIAVPSVEAFATPLGTVPVDRDAITSILDLPGVRITDAPHAPEHALEVELPFLQRLLGDFAIVPLLFGDVSPREAARILEPLRGGAETLLVISSDLSHYLDYATARQRDAATAAAIERLTPETIGPCDACGCRALCGLLVEAKARGLEAERLDLRNSGDTAGPKRSVVGYGAWAFRSA